MNIHEHQAKDLLRNYGINIPEGTVIFNADEIEPAVASFNAPVLVVKAQIHAGGRGKGGGVKVAKTPADAIAYAHSMLDMNLVTKQTGSAGKRVQRVYIEPGVNIKKELYLSYVIDRETSHITIIASTEGGMDIEEVAEKHPDKIIKISINPITGFQPFHGRQLAIGLNLPINAKNGIGPLCRNLFKLFVGKDLAMLEINPVVITSDDALIPLDAKISFDDNALFRHPDIQALRDLTEEDPKEIEASTMYPLTATSVAWLTVLGLPWQPWTSLNFTAVNLQTFWMLVGVQPKKKFNLPLKLFYQILLSKESW